MKWLVTYESQWPGYDEFNRFDEEVEVVDAETKQEAEAEFWKLKDANTERNSLKFAVGVRAIEPFRLTTENF